MSKRKSVIVFSMHRSASTFLIGFLKNLAMKLEMEHVFNDPSLESMPENRGRPARIVPKNWKLSRTGAIYGPYRRYIELDGIENFTNIIVLRDPRDVLISLYYSNLFSHDAPREPAQRAKFVEEEQMTREAGIDGYCIKAADRMILYYDIYKAAQKEHKMRVLSYEEMVTDFPSFVRKFLEYADFPPNLSGFLVEKFHQGFSAPAENKYKHKRQITPGDHRRKLKRDTIKILNEKFANVLPWLNLSN